MSFSTVSKPGPVGICPNTHAGTLNWPTLNGALHVNEKLLLKLHVPPIVTKLLGAPPVHVTVTPCDRFTVEIELMFVH